jgi:UDP-N-acetylmuramate--alanine ligase
MNRLDHISFNQFNAAYFVGVGGIGMSALARYFKSLGWEVSGYDKTPSTLTNELMNEGIHIHFEDQGEAAILSLTDIQRTIFIYTPAIPKDHKELAVIRDKGLSLFKRSEVLGLITRQSKGLGVAGTHGKTTTSSMLAHILNQSSKPCDAFLGGIATNFNSNLLIGRSAEYTVIEADEFDRSFLQLKPFASIVTSTDADHLDIYGDSNEFIQGFQQYTQLIEPTGCLVKREGLDVHSSAKTITYALDSSSADYSVSNLRMEDGRFYMDVRTPNAVWNEVELGIPGIHNAENALACIALLEFLSISENEIRTGLSTFLGVKRRFEYHLRKPNLVYIDDYAHHPTEIHALIASIRLLYPDKKITGIFQPHLFSRTRDFFDGFAKELSKLDDLILMPIYPARELPIEGVTSDALLEAISLKSKRILLPEEVLKSFKGFNNGVVLTIGAGDIDRIVEPLKKVLS